MTSEIQHNQNEERWGEEVNREKEQEEQEGTDDEHYHEKKRMRVERKNDVDEMHDNMPNQEEKKDPNEDINTENEEDKAKENADSRKNVQAKKSKNGQTNWKDDEMQSSDDGEGETAASVEEEEDDEEEEDNDEEEEDFAKDYQKKPRTVEQSSMIRRSSLMNGSGRDSARARDRRGSSRYSGELRNPLLRSRNFCWPEYRDQKLQDMKKEGWIIDSSQSTSIGSTIRRFFRGFGKADGVVVSKLPAELNEGHCIWHVVHDDGDSEDLSDDDLQLCREMYLRNDTEPNIPSHRIEHLYRSKNNDITFPLYRKSCQIGVDFQVPSLPECHDSRPSSTSPTGTENSSDDTSSSDFLISKSIQFEMESITSLSTFQEFHHHAMERLLFQGAVTRYLGSPSTSKSHSTLHYLDLVCLISKLSSSTPSSPPSSSPSSQSQSLDSSPVSYIIFDGVGYHTCHLTDLAQPYTSQINLPNIFLENNCQLAESLDDLQHQINRLIESQFTANQLLILQTYFTYWVKYGSNIKTSYTRSTLHSLISYPEMVHLYYLYLPYLARNEDNGSCDRIKAVYDCSFALHGIACKCLIEQKDKEKDENKVADVEEEKTETEKGVHWVEEDGSWGVDDDIDVFFPKGFRANDENSRSDEIAGPHAKKQVDQVDLQSGTVIRSYATVALAARATGLESKFVSLCCNGKRRSAGGYIWRYSEPGGPSSSSSSSLLNSQRNSREKSITGLIRKPVKKQIQYPAHEVEALDLVTGEVVNSHSSVTVASQATGLSSSSIWKCCMGVEPSSGNYKWRFKDQTLLPSQLEAVEEISDEENDQDEDYSPSIFERTGPKQVEQLDLETGTVLNIFPSGVAAGRAAGIGQKPISECCHGRRLSAGGFRWRFHQLTPGEEEAYINGAGSVEKSKTHYQPSGPKPVEQVDMKTGEILKVFDSGADAAREFGISPNAISSCCNGRRVSAAGFQWRFAPRLGVPIGKVNKTKEDLSSEVTNRTVKPVEQVNIINGSVLRVYPSCIEAAKSMGLHVNAIFACCGGRRLYAGGYRWRFQATPTTNGTVAESGAMPVVPAAPGANPPPAPASAPAPGPGASTVPSSGPGPVTITIGALGASVGTGTGPIFGSMQGDRNAQVLSSLGLTHPIEKLDIKTRTVVGEYLTCAEAANSVGVHSNLISLCCLGRIGTAGGYSWRFKNGERFSSPTPKFTRVGGDARLNSTPRGFNHALLADTRMMKPQEQVKKQEDKKIEEAKIESKVESIAPSTTTTTTEVHVEKQIAPIPSTTSDQSKVSLAVEVIAPRPVSVPSVAVPVRVEITPPPPTPPTPLPPPAPPLPPSPATTGTSNDSDHVVIKHSNAGCEIEQINSLTGELVATYPSFRAAGKQLNITPRAISLCVMGKRKSAGGFFWRYRVQSSNHQPSSTSEPDSDTVEVDPEEAESNEMNSVNDEILTPHKDQERSVNSTMKISKELNHTNHRAQDEEVAGTGAVQTEEGIAEELDLVESRLENGAAVEEKDNENKVEDGAKAEVENDDDDDDEDEDEKVIQEETMRTRTARKRKSTIDPQLYEYNPTYIRSLKTQPVPKSTKSVTQSPPPLPTSPTNRLQPVQQINLTTGEVIQTFPSRAEASRSSGVSANEIGLCCRGTKPSAGGFLWRFEEENSLSTK